MNNKEKILDLYFNQHLQQIEIAKKLNVTKQYVSKTVNQDSRAKEEKENRKQQNVEKRQEYMKSYFQNYTRPEKENNSYEQLKVMQEQDAKELSYNSNNISDYAFVKWNLSAYHRTIKGNLILDKKLNAGADAPKTINMNIKVPTQKCKNL